MNPAGPSRDVVSNSSDDDDESEEKQQPQNELEQETESSKKNNKRPGSVTTNNSHGNSKKRRGSSLRRKAMKTTSVPPEQFKNGRFSCSFPLCDFSTIWEFNLLRHERTHDPNRRKSFKCHSCSKEFDFKCNLQRHLDRVHPTATVGLKRSDRIPNALLAKAQKSKLLLKTPLMPSSVKRKPIRKPQKSSGKYPSTLPARMPQGSTIKFPILPGSLPKSSRRTPQESTMECVVSTAPSAQRPLRKSKVKSNSSSQEKNQNNNNNFKRKKSGGARALLECPHCKYQTTFQSNLFQHVRIHLDEKPYACSYSECEFRSKWAHNVREHERRVHEQGGKPRPINNSNINNNPTHTTCPIKQEMGTGVNSRLLGKSTHYCPFCSKSFTYDYNVARHIRKAHGGAKAEETFPNSSKKITSEVIVGQNRNPSTCPYCQFQGSSRKSVLGHMRLEHGDKKLYPCEFPHCQYSSRWSKCLKTHERKVHGLHGGIPADVKLGKQQLNLLQNALRIPARSAVDYDGCRFCLYVTRLGRYLQRHLRSCPGCHRPTPSDSSEHDGRSDISANAQIKSERFESK